MIGSPGGGGCRARGRSGRCGEYGRVGKSRTAGQPPRGTGTSRQEDRPARPAFSSPVPGRRVGTVFPAGTRYGAGPGVDGIGADARVLVGPDSDDPVPHALDDETPG